MNTFKLINLVAILIVLSSCSKTEDPIEPVLKVECDNITLVVNNRLPNDIENIVIGNQNYGTIAAGASDILCLESSLAYNPQPEELMLFIQARYQGEEITDGFFCGTGLMTIDSGEFEIDLDEVNDNYLHYSFQ